MLRIGGGVFPVIKEPDYLVNGDYRVDKGAAPKMLNCLMYKLSYYRFGELTTEYGKPPGNFDLIESIDDHYVVVTSVKVTCNGNKIISCSVDRSLIFLDVNIMDTGCKVSRCHHQMVSHGTVYDMALDLMMEAVITVGQVLNLNFCHHGFNSSMKNLYVPWLFSITKHLIIPLHAL